VSLCVFRAPLHLLESHCCEIRNGAVVLNQKQDSLFPVFKTVVVERVQTGKKNEQVDAYKINSTTAISQQLYYYLDLPDDNPPSFSQIPAKEGVKQQNLKQAS
jgi:hypothetical protein